MEQPTLSEDFDLKPRRGLLTPRAPLETLLAAAVRSVSSGKRAPHCYRAWVQGKGHVNDGNPHLYDRADYLRQLTRSIQSEVDNIGYASTYAEPGYTQPKGGILFANWNYFPRGFDSVLEAAGYTLEWSDEWSTCYGCDKAIRTSPNSYHWSGAYAIVNECDLLCLECIADDPADYLDEICGNSNRCVTETLADKIDLQAAGFTEYAPPDGQYESGWHPHQTDDPKKIVATLVSEGIDPARILFVQTEQSQFYIGFKVWLRNEETDDDSTALAKAEV